LDTSDYSFGDRLLHHLVLGIPLVSKSSFDLEGFLSDKGMDCSNERHVFISGLARAGTTILMRTFYDTGQFRSLTYRDMPFVLMPGLWKKVSKPFYRDQVAKERAHGDGILEDFDSPEAFEEVFWRTFSSDDYIFDDYLQPYDLKDELVSQFRLYVNRIIQSSKNSDHRCYLSKNNNNILRLRAIRKAFPNALIIIPFRDPVQQAISLLDQHKKFFRQHSIDKFSYEYMGWLGHHEFGGTHKPFRFDASIRTQYETDNINYWLNIWIDTYQYLLENALEDSIFICFEELCTSPIQTLGRLFESANIPLDEGRVKGTINSPVRKEDIGVDGQLMDRAEQVYRDLLALIKPV